MRRSGRGHRRIKTDRMDAVIRFDCPKCHAAGGISEWPDLMDIDTILHGDSLEMLRGLPDGCVQCCITSPPYWGLRDYGVEGQLGLEPTPEEYVSKMVEIFAEVRRVLRDDGTLWLNLGDSYNGSGGAGGDYNKGGLKEGQPKYGPKMAPTLKPKDLIGIPWRVAFALQADGWYLRSDIIWSKPNPMPESVTDRPTKAHEYVFLMSKSSRYYYDNEAVKEPLLSSESVYLRAGKSVRENHQYGEVAGRPLGDKSFATMPSGRNRRTVWTITTRPYPEAHFAVFPETLVEPCLMAGSKEGDTVLDPFMGSGTVAKVALRARRHYIGIELNKDYIALAEKRLEPFKKQGNLI